MILVCAELFPAGDTWPCLDCHDSHLSLLQGRNAHEEAGKEADGPVFYDSFHSQKKKLD